MAIQEILFYASIVFFVLAALFIGLAIYWFFAKHIRDVMDDLNGKKLAADVEREASNIGRGDRNRRRQEPSSNVKAFVQASAPQEKWRTGGSKSSGWSSGSGAYAPTDAARAGASAGSSTPSSADVSAGIYAQPSAVASAEAFAGASAGSSAQPSAEPSVQPVNDDLYETDIFGEDIDYPATEIFDDVSEGLKGGVQVAEDDAVTSAPALANGSVSSETFKVIDKILFTDSSDYITAV